MGLMNKLRDKTHIILIILIVAFLATIVFEWGMDYMGMRGGEGGPEFGSVNGHEIKLTDFEQQVQFAVEQQRQQTGQEPDDQLIQMIRDQVWEQLVSQALIEEEIKRLGITVTNQEILNWVYNSPQTLPDPIKRNFVDSTGQFNMAVYQQALTTKTPEVTQFWGQVEEYLKNVLLQQKLQSVITGTVRVTEGEVMQKYRDDNLKANVDYLFLDVNGVQDNQVQFGEEDLKAYYDKNKFEFKREESAKLRYVIFSDAATMDDTIRTKKELQAFARDLKALNPNDSLTWKVFTDNTGGVYSNKFTKPNEIIPELSSYLFTAAKDSISEVIAGTDGFHVVRLIDSRDGDQTFVGASHILISLGTDTNAAKQKADQLYQRLKAGEDFTKLAAENSDDPSNKFKGGALGWFTKGAMVKEFEDAAMNAAVGEIVGPVKTQFGYHIIKVTGRSNKEFKFADMKKMVTASGKTKDAARKKAEDFAFISKEGNMDEEAKKLGIQIVDLPTLITADGMVPGAGQNKIVNNFAMQNKKGTISDPIKIQNGYAVYLIADKFAAGIAPFEEVKATQVANMVKLQKKLDMLKQQANDLKGKSGGNILSLKASNPQLNIQTADSISASKPAPMVGNDPDFNNTVFKLQAGQISEPIRTLKGYYLVQVKAIDQFDNNKYQQEYNTIRTQLVAQKKQTIVQDWLAEMKKNAKIVDNRDKYFRQ